MPTISTPAARRDSEPTDCDCTGALPSGALFRHAVCRTAGLPVHCLEGLRAPDATAVLDELWAVESELDALRPGATEALYRVIGDTGERKRRGRLLEIRRDVHNLRPLTRRRLERVAAGLPSGLAADLARYAELSERRRELAERLPAVVGRELGRARRAFQAAVADPDFRRGLVLSSRVLLGELERYRTTPVEELGAKERQIERGLLRYYSRMVMKTTPFGTFTAVVPARLVPEGGDSRFAGDPRHKVSVVRLNKRIYATLRDELASSQRGRRHLDVELNPTLHPDGEHWRFLTGDAGSELFQRLPRNPVLDLYQTLLAAAPRTLGELERGVADHPGVEASAEEVAAYTARLLEVGFLRLRFGIPPQRVDWDRPLARLLAELPGDAAERAARFLATLRAHRDAFVSAPVERRLELVDAALDTMRDSYPVLFEPSKLRADVPFYEDAGADAELHLPRPELAAVERSLVEYVALTSRLAWPRHEGATMRHFYDLTYGGEAAVPLLRFYEDFHRHHLKAQIEERRQRREELGDGGDGDGAAADEMAGEAEMAEREEDYLNPYGLELIDRIRAANDGLTRSVQERWRAEPDAAVLHLGRDELAAAVAGIPPSPAPRFSTSVFAQVLPDTATDGGPALLVSSLLRGFGKYFSRFLAVLPEEVHEALLERTGEGDTRGPMLAEIGADGDFNANLHPPLVPWEVAYPTAEGGATESSLAVTDLAVEPDPADPHALLLRHGPSGRQVIPLDLGFQNPLMRPPLFQLLSQLAPPSNFHFQLPDLPWPRGEEGTGDSEVVQRPRVVFDGRLVLARRRWVVPRELFPYREGHESDSDYLRRADAWRRRHGIPREFFISLFPLPPADRHAERDKGGEAPPPRRRHVHKPQYIDFANPLLVDLFGRLADEEAGGYRIQLYERLPHRRHLPACGDDRYVTELVLQVDFPEGLEPGRPA